MTRYEAEAIEPGSREDDFNRADPGCERCDGRGRTTGDMLGGREASCPCTHQLAPFVAGAGFLAPHVVRALNHHRDEGRIKDWTPGPLGTYHVLPPAADRWFEMTGEQAFVYVTGLGQEAQRAEGAARRLLDRLVAADGSTAAQLHNLAHRRLELPLAARRLAHLPFDRSCGEQVR